MKTRLLKIFTFLFFIPYLLIRVSAQTLSPTPGLKTIKNLLQTALAPVGSTLYVWGGGHFENRDIQKISYGSTHIGVHPEWKMFYDSQNENYKWDDWNFQTKKGLDCSGYIGWVVYNIMNTESGNEGYVY